MLIGISGSGKSTFVKDNWPAFGRAVLVSTDAIRKGMFGDEADQSRGGEVFRLAYNAVHSWLKEGYSVVFDATSTTDKSRRRLLNAVRDIPCRKVAVLFTVQPGVAKERNNKRKRVVPPDVIDRQFAQLKADAHLIQELYDEIFVVGG